MKTIKTIKAVSAAILFTATLASAQVSAPASATVKAADDVTAINFSITVEPEAAITVNGGNVTKDTPSFVKTGMTLTGAGTTPATSPVSVGNIAVTTNLSSWDVWVKSDNGGKLLNTSGVELACGTPTTTAKLYLYACLQSGPTACAGTGTINAAGGAATPRRLIPLASSAGAFMSMAQYMKVGTASSTPAAVATRFNGADAALSDSHIMIEAGVDCAPAQLAPGPDAVLTEKDYKESLTFTLTSTF